MNRPILFVDDDVMIISLWKDQCEDAGLTGALFASTLLEALQHIEQNEGIPILVCDGAFPLVKKGNAYYNNGEFLLKHFHTGIRVVCSGDADFSLRMGKEGNAEKVCKKEDAVELVVLNINDTRK